MLSAHRVLGNACLDLDRQFASPTARTAATRAKTDLTDGAHQNLVRFDVPQGCFAESGTLPFQRHRSAQSSSVSPPARLRVRRREAVMAWVEDRAGCYRVRYRRAGHIVTDSTHADRDDAFKQAALLNDATRAARQRYMPLPTPRLGQWVEVWLSSHLAADSTMARYRSMLRCHILPVSASDGSMTSAGRTSKPSPVTCPPTSPIPACATSSPCSASCSARPSTTTSCFSTRPPDSACAPAHGSRGPFATAGQVQQIAARMPDTVTRTLVTTAAYTGMRMSELLALTRANVHLPQATFTYRRRSGLCMR